MKPTRGLTLFEWGGPLEISASQLKAHQMAVNAAAPTGVDVCRTEVQGQEETVKGIISMADVEGELFYSSRSIVTLVTFLPK